MLGKSFKIVEPKRFDLYIEDVFRQSGELIVRIDYAAICKADIRYYLGARDKRTLGFKYPMNLLHEAVGTIVAGKEKEFKYGDRVALVPNIVTDKKKCHHCVCDNQNLGENYCPNAKFASSNLDGFAREYVSYPTSNLVKIPPNINSNTAVFSELISVAVASYRRTILKGDEVIGVWGDGILGYILCCVLKELHKNGKIIAIGKHRGKLKEFPADRVYLIDDSKIKSEGIQVAFECVGGSSSGLAINEAIDVTLVGGRIILTGVAEEHVGINTRRILEKGLSLYGVTRSNIADFHQTIELLGRNSFYNRISNLILSNEIINNIVDFYNVFEMELMNRRLGKHILYFNL